MTDLLVFREQLKKFYSKYELYLTPVFKFLLALVTLVMINSSIGYMSELKKNDGGLGACTDVLCASDEFYRGRGDGGDAGASLQIFAGMRAGDAGIVFAAVYFVFPVCIE